MEILDLGCGKDKYPKSFGVDFSKNKGVDLVWDLNKQLPKKFYNKYNFIFSRCLLEHLGNPMLFLEGCYNYLKKNGKLIIITDNADYWRYHFHFGSYHADLWEDGNEDIKTHHKLLFQMKHLNKLLEIIGFKISKMEYYSDYDNLNFLKKLRKGHIDFLLPPSFGKNRIKIEAIKS